MIRGGAAARKMRPILRTPAGEPPGVLSVSPSSGSAAGGTTVTVELDAYVGSYGVVGVTFGGVAGTDVTIVDHNTITAVTPAHADGIATVIVTNRWGRGRKNDAFTFDQLGDGLLQENGDGLLQENGDRLLLEDANG